MNEVESVYDASLSEPTQLEIDCAVFKAWTQGIKGQHDTKKQKPMIQKSGKYMMINSDLLLSCVLSDPLVPLSSP